MNSMLCTKRVYWENMFRLWYCMGLLMMSTRLVQDRIRWEDMSWLWYTS